MVVCVPLDKCSNPPECTIVSITHGMNSKFHEEGILLMTGTEEIKVMVKGTVVSLKLYIITCTVLVSIFLLMSNMRLGYLGSTARVNKDKTDTNTFYINRFKLYREFIELSGHYGHHETNSSMHYSNITLRLEGIEQLLQEIKQSAPQDDNTGSTLHPVEELFKVNRKVKDVHCYQLFEKDENETKKAIVSMRKKPHAEDQISAEEYINITANCSTFKSLRGYILTPLTEVEETFPIAFSILMYKDVWQFERLLRAIYRTQNIYCLHVDSKSDASIYKAVSMISQCFDNVFISSKRFDVQWAEITVLEPELACMQDLWNKSKTWKYFINLTGQEFPLRTNYELVRILNILNGKNDVQRVSVRATKYRWKNAGPLPHRLVPVKGAVHVAVCRGFVDFILHDPRAQHLLNWTRKTIVPDETFFATLNYNRHLQVPGSYRVFRCAIIAVECTGCTINFVNSADPDETAPAGAVSSGSSLFTDRPATYNNIKPFIARYKQWTPPCHGKFVRDVCVFGIGDLPILAQRKELFANKFNQDFQRFTLDCLEELHYNRTRDQYLGKLMFNSSWYSHLGFI